MIVVEDWLDVRRWRTGMHLDRCSHDDRVIPGLRWTQLLRSLLRVFFRFSIIIEGRLLEVLPRGWC